CWCRPLLPAFSKVGSPGPLTGIETACSASTSASLPVPTWSLIWRFNSSRPRRRKRCRLPRLLSLGLRRRSMTVGITPPAPRASARLVHTHVPFHQPPDLPLGIAALDHTLHKFGML